MYNSFDLSTLMPVLAVIFTLVIIVALIMVIGKTIQTKILTFNQRSLEELASELKADNTAIKSELAAIKSTLDSINKMMKEIQ